MKRESIPSNSMPLQFERAATQASQERNAVLVASAVLYTALTWLCWPCLSYAANAYGDQRWIDTFRGLATPQQALRYVGTSWFRPGENLLFWALAHSQTLQSWRFAMLTVFLLTVAYVQIDASIRGRSYIDGFGAAIAFSLSPTSLSVVCWLSAARISLSALGILAYFALAQRALDRADLRKRDVIAALSALVFALSFYELALFSPLIVLAYHRWCAPRASARAARLLHFGGAACVALYLAVQAQVAHALRFWDNESPTELFASSMRYAMRNYYLWFNPFETFGVRIPDEAGDHTTENIVCWLLMCSGFVVVWLCRKSDPISALSGLWFSVFLIPVGTFFHFEGDTVAEHHLYIPMMGVAVGGVRIFTRLIERCVTAIRNQPLRVAFEGTLSVVLLWSLAPLIDQCTHIVERWRDATALYTATLEHYPQNVEVLRALTEALAAQSEDVPVQAQTEPPPPVWQPVVDAVLMRDPPPTAASLLATGRTLMHDVRYTEASSVLTRAFVMSSTQREQLDTGEALVQALSHTELRAQAAALLSRLRALDPERAQGLTLDLSIAR